MTFRPCLVVPVYDPGPTLARTVAALLPHGLSLFIIDDGSGPATRTELDHLAATQSRIHLVRLPRNRGKGAAVMEGLRVAALEGFTHALQMDADGQHDARAVPSFLAMGRANPTAIISGVPQFDASVPRTRLFGRRFSHLWVWLGTLSMDIQDSLCGFRLYPLASTLQLMDRVAIAPRMAFDTEIIMRLHQAGVPVLNAPVKVTYPRDGVSHYRAWADTLGIIRMQLAMVARLPWVVLKKGRAPRAQATPWYRIKEGGSVLGFRLVLWLHRILGPRAVRVLSEVVACYFFLTARGARRASRDYLSRLHAHFGPLPDLPGRPRVRDTYRHFRAFTRATVDKFLAWSGYRQDLEVDFPGQADFLALVQSGQGAIFLSAHLGNLDMMRALGVGGGLKGLNAVVYSENAAHFHQFLRRVNPQAAHNLIQVSQVSPAMAIDLQEKVDRGEFLFIVADRIPPMGERRTLPAPFLGSPAPFPMGPFLLAHLLKCPVYTLFCVREAHRYRMYMAPFAEPADCSRDMRAEALAQWAGRYSRAVEARCQVAPFEWFNFFDFWRSHPIDV